MEQKRCMYCGKPIEKTKYTLRAGKHGEMEVWCCGTECYQAMKRYVEDTHKKKNILYIIAAILIMMNLFIFGYKESFRWMYLPMIGLGIVLTISPSLYVTNWFFENCGVKKTVKYVRTAGIVIILLGVIFTLAW